MQTAKGKIEMATAKDQNGAKPGGEVKQRRESDVTTSPVRVGAKTKAKLEQLVTKANKDRLGRKIKADDLIEFSLGLLMDTHLDQICAKTLSNKDRLELLYRKLSKEKRGMSREEFFGLLLDGRLNNAPEPVDRTLA